MFNWEELDEYYRDAYQAEQPMFYQDTFPWQELEQARNRLEHTHYGPQATPDDWLDTILWIKQLPEVR